MIAIFILSVLATLATYTFPYRTRSQGNLVSFVTACTMATAVISGWNIHSVLGIVLLCVAAILLFIDFFVA